MENTTYPTFKRGIGITYSAVTKKYGGNLYQHPNGKFVDSEAIGRDQQEAEFTGVTGTSVW